MEWVMWKFQQIWKTKFLRQVLFYITFFYYFVWEWREGFYKLFICNDASL